VGGTLRLDTTTPETIDPAIVRDAGSAGYAIEVFAGLTRVNAELRPEPALARNWEITDGGRRYRFELRDGLQFHDGRPLTADDVRWSWERALHPSTGSHTASVTLGNIEGADALLSGDADTLSGVRVLSDQLLEVRLVQHAAYFPALVAQGASLVVDRENVAQGPDWSLRPNGSGPYRLTSFRRRSEVVLESAPTYLPRQSGPAVVRFTEFAPGESLLRYEQDQLDIVRVGGSNIDRFSDPREPRAAELRQTPTLALAYLGFNTSRPPFDDPHARRAFTHAVDRPRINRVTLRGHHAEARGILPPGMPGYRPNYTGLPFDLDAARRELQLSRHGPVAEWPELVVASSGAGLIAGPISRAVVEPWRDQLGVDISVEQYDFLDYLDVVENLTTAESSPHAFVLSWIADFPDPFGFLDMLFGSKRPDNYGGFNDGFVDLLLALASSEPRHERRLALYRLAESRIVERAAAVPLYHSVSHELVQPWVTQYPGQPVVREWLTDVEIAPR
jgi:ABC-type transport system substrate-binding protein